MAFHEIEGQAQVKRFLQSNSRTGRLAHSYLFSGPAGVGKLAMARALAQTIYCDADGDDACGVCVSCRKFLSGNLLTYREIEAEKGKKSIGIDQMRRLQDDLKFCAEDQYRKIYVIKEADRLNVNAANSMLKYLEEPNSNQLAILLTVNEQALPATVLSRLQIVRFMPPDPQQVLSNLGAHLTAQAAAPEGQFDPELMRLAAHVSGSAEEAAGWLQREWFAEYRQLVIELTQVMLKRPAPVIIALQKRMAKWKAEAKKHLDLLAQMLELVFRDLIYHLCGRTHQLVFVENRDSLYQLAVQREIGFWVHCAEEAVRLRRKRAVNANWQMILEQFFIDIEKR